MVMAAYIIGMQKIASLASPKKRVVEQGFLEFFQDDGLEPEAMPGLLWEV
jgi:hypothetical protein